MHDHPSGLVPFSYLRKTDVVALRAAGLRVWISKEPNLSAVPNIGAYGAELYMAFVEPWVIDIIAVHTKLKSSGRDFAGLTLMEMVLGAIPEKNPR